jgi:hypothetical protein
VTFPNFISAPRLPCCGWMGSCATGCVAGASALLPEVAWSCELLLACGWGGRGAAGGVVAVVVPAGVRGWWVQAACARSQVPALTRSHAKSGEQKSALGRGFSIATRPRGNRCAGRQRSLAAPAPNLQPPYLPPEEAGAAHAETEAVAEDGRCCMRALCVITEHLSQVAAKAPCGRPSHISTG